MLLLVFYFYLFFLCLYLGYLAQRSLLLAQLLANKTESRKAFERKTNAPRSWQKCLTKKDMYICVLRKIHSVMMSFISGVRYKNHINPNKTSFVRCEFTAAVC